MEALNIKSEAVSKDYTQFSEYEDPEYREIYQSHTGAASAPYVLQYPSDLSVSYQFSDKVNKLTGAFGASPFSIDVDKPYILFQCKNAQQSYTPIGYIVLYLPPELKVKYTAEYGELARTVKRVLTGAQSAKTATQEGETSTSDGIKNAILAIKNDGELGEELSYELKKTVNPHMAQIFKNVNFRSFSFSFQFMARSEEEAKSIKKIIAAFKMGMHPGTAGAGEAAYFWQYPDNYEIKLFTGGTGGIDSDKMFKINTCALEDMDVDYGGSGIPSFFKDGHPVDVRLTLTFKELEVLTKEKIKKGY